METYKVVINGRAVDGDAGTLEVRNPASGAPLGFAPVSSPSQVDAAVAAAKRAQAAWAAQPDAQRRQLLNEVAEVLAANSDYLARWITREQGKPLAGPGSLFEMQACVGWTRAVTALQLPVEVVFEDDTRRDELHRRPIGVIAAIAPWNWPLMIAVWQIVPALRTGNTVVLKPSEYTPLGTLEMIRLVSEVLPPGVVNTLGGDGSVGDRLVRHNDVRKIMFTGSLETGKKIIAASADNLARLTLELGGNDAAIVLKSCNPEAIAEPLFWGAFINMGQTCACAKRLYVHEDVYERVIAALKGVVERMPMGDGLEHGIVLGPVQNRMQFDKVHSLVEDARRRGARIVTGGAPLKRDGYFYPITLVADIDDDASLVREEQFGPVLPIMKYRDESDAIRRANQLETALGASVWSSDPKAALRVASQLEAGTVWINQHGAIHPMVPFGGIKSSGYGLEFGLEGLKAVTQPQVISIKK